MVTVGILPPILTPTALSLCSPTTGPTTRSYNDDFLHIITFLALLTRANTRHAIFIFMFFYHISMSIDIESLVRSIIKDECEGCKDECELCQLGPCEHLVTHVGLFFIEWAIDEFEKKEKQ